MYFERTRPTDSGAQQICGHALGAPRVHARGLAALAIAAALGASACGAGDTIVVVLPGASLEADAGRDGPAGGAATTDAGPNAADAAAPGAGGSTPTVVDAGATGGSLSDASAPRMDAETPRMDAGTPSADAGVRDASVDAAVPLPDPGPYGCADAPFYPDGGACLVDDPCVRGGPAVYRASASLQCTGDGHAEELTCASSSPLRVFPFPVPPSTLLRVTDFQALPVRMRTPKVVAGGLACPAECAGVPTNASGVMRFQLALPFRERVTVKVGAPWQVAVDLPNPFCVTHAVSSSPSSVACLAHDMQTATITVFTTAFYAPSRDVLVDVTARTTCP